MHIDGIHYNPDCSCKSCKMVTNNKRDMKTPEVKDNKCCDCQEYKPLMCFCHCHLPEPIEEK
jgi:hypothetical protein